MPESTLDKTEPASPRKREEARAEGQVSRSADLTAAVVLLGGLFLLQYTGDRILSGFLEVTRQCLGQGAPGELDPSRMMPTLRGAVDVGAAVVLPVMLGLTVLALLACLGQVGVLLTFKPLRPKLDKLDPINGFRRMFSARSAVHLVLGLAKMGLLSLVAWSTVRNRVDVLAQIPAMAFPTIVGLTCELVFTLGLRLAIALLVLAVIDYIYQRRKFESDLRMTKEEVRQELRNMEGDQKIKGRRRQIQFQMAMQRVRSTVPKADVVVTNPTEYAVALRYDTESMNAPKLGAKGHDQLAKRIREVAIEHGVPIVERPPLARALYRQVEVGQEIPAALYKAVAEVLAYVYELAGRGYRRQPRPAAADAVSVN